MEIDLEYYLTEDDRKAIVAEEFHKICADKFRTDSERIFSNAAYEVVIKAMNEMSDWKWASEIAIHAKRVIATLTASTVFAQKNHWDTTESEGFKTLQRVMKESGPLIEKRIAEVIGELSHDDLRNYIADSVHNLCDEKLFTKPAKNAA